MTAPIDRARAAVRDVFGFPDFRPGQEEIVRAILAGRDILAVMPTGAGKSLCYQVPAMVCDGLAVVVSPLIALMRDQVRQLELLGVAAASLNSANSAEENKAARDKLHAGRLDLLYIAPERLTRPDMIDLLAGSNARLLAVDEAHCVSQWGHDFRPDYLQIGPVRAALGVPLAAFTATADEATRAEIAAKLFDAPPDQFVHGFDRPNLFLAMSPKSDRARQLLAFAKAHASDSGIVYCASRKRTHSVADMLSKNGVPAIAYHAGMEKAERAAAQDRFLREDGLVIAATVAFGMGIDKPDVRFVAHDALPKSIEAYYQEIGRAGRDGLPAATLTLYGADDIRLRRTQIAESEMTEDQKQVEHRRLAALLALCEAPRCRRQTLLAYFGETTDPCGHCDLCTADVARADATVEAQKALSAILRTGQRFGTEHLVSLLLGEQTEQMTRLNHHRLPTFGVGTERDRAGWRTLYRQLYALGLIDTELRPYAGWHVTEAGRKVLKGEERLSLRTDVTAPRTRRKKGSAAPPPEAADADPALLAALKALRTELASEQGVPAYVIFPDRTLIEMAAKKPQTLDALRALHGIGEAKLERYGARFLETVRTR